MCVTKIRFGHKWIRKIHSKIFRSEPNSKRQNFMQLPRRPKWGWNRGQNSSPCIFLSLTMSKSQRKMSFRKKRSYAPHPSHYQNQDEARRNSTSKSKPYIFSTMSSRILPKIFPYQNPGSQKRGSKLLWGAKSAAFSYYEWKNSQLEIWKGEKKTI